MDDEEPPERPDQVMTIRVTASEKAALKRIADANNLTMSEIIRTALKTEHHDTAKMLSKARRVQGPNPETLMQLARLGGLLKAIHRALLLAKHNGTSVDLRKIFDNQKAISTELKAIRQTVDQDRPC